MHASNSSGRLLEIALPMLSNEDYVIQKFTRVGGVAGYRHSTAAQPLEDTVPFYPQKCNHVAHATRHEVLVDGVERNVVQSSVLRRQLEEHVKHNLVRIGNKVYRQISGIPQGSCLSSLLINMHYTVLESLCVPPRARNHLWLLLRLVDDWLLLTTDAAAARAFMRNLSSGHPEFGCSVSAGKSSANFDIKINGESVRRFDTNDVSCVSWCGLLLDVKTLEIRLDYSRFFSDGSVSRHLRDSVSVETNRNPGQALRAQTVRFARLRAHGFLFDRSLNSQCTAMENCFALFAHTAMRFHTSYTLLRQATESSARASWFISLVQATINGVCATVRGRVAQIHREVSAASSAADVDAEPALHSLGKSEIACLGLHAFIAVFAMRLKWYSAVVPALRLLLEKQPDISACASSPVRALQELFSFADLIRRCAPGCDAPLHSGRHFSAHIVLMRTSLDMCSERLALRGTCIWARRAFRHLDAPRCTKRIKLCAGRQQCHKSECSAERLPLITFVTPDKVCRISQAF